METESMEMAAEETVRSRPAGGVLRSPRREPLTAIRSLLPVVMASMTLRMRAVTMETRRAETDA